MTRIDLVAQAQQVISEVVREGDMVIDATLGNGHDALFLAQLIGDSGHLYGFDIQPAAIAASQQRLTEHHMQERITLLQYGHEAMYEHIPAQHHGRIKAVMFNLGYLPGHDHTLRTRVHTTLQALKSAAALLAPGGMLTVIAYTGHEHGRDETEAVKLWARDLAQQNYRMTITIPPSRNNNAPELIAITRTKP